MKTFSSLPNHCIRLECVSTVNTEYMTEHTTCDPKSVECMYGRCESCAESSFPVIMTAMKPDDQFSYSKWVTKKNDDGFQVTVKITIESKVNDVIDEFQNSLRRFRKHIFNDRNQYEHYRLIRQHLQDQDDETECLCHVDFSENYVCRYGTEIQSAHFGASHSQATLHTGCLYVGKNTLPFCTISSSRQHDPSAIWAHLSPVLEWMLQKYPSIDKVHFFSDGPTTQYRQKKNFYLFAQRLGRFTTATWNFFESSHGKGAPDGIGGVLKRTADRQKRRAEPSRCEDRV